MSPDHAPCPACGYDLSGIAASWRDWCPLHGVCSECGEPVRWDEVLKPAPRVLPWFVEHPGRFMARRVAATWIKTALPWRFWREVGARAPGSAWRMILWLPLLLLGLHATKAVLANAARYVVHSQNGFQPRVWAVWASDDWTQPFLLIYYNYTPVIRVQSMRWQFDFWPAAVWGLLAASIVAPVTLLGVRWLTEHDNRSKRELVRAAVYGLAWAPLLWLAGVADGAWRLTRCLWGAQQGVGIDSWDVEWLYEQNAWRHSGWWGSAIAVWWVLWWWHAVMRGARVRPSSELAVVVIGAGLCAGVLTLAAAEVLAW